MSRAAAAASDQEWVPLPPPHLIRRIGGFAGDPFAAWEQSGRVSYEDFLALLPDDFSFEGKRALDFGCGVGRVLRHFQPHTEVAEFYGCDIDAESVDWMQRNMDPPFTTFKVEENPPMPQPDGHFDLIWAHSIFTHLTDNWSSVLLDLHRVLSEDGILILTFIGRGLEHPPWSFETWDDGGTGMNVLHYEQSWDLGGPLVFHSPWWIREHWGRAFEILDIWEAGFNHPHDRTIGQGAAVMRRKDVSLTPSDLEEIRPADEPREITALQHNIAQLHRESKRFRDYWAHHSQVGHQDIRQVDQLTAEIAGLRELVQDQARLLTIYEGSRSWRMTAPLRRLRHRITGRRARPAQRPR